MKKLIVLLLPLSALFAQPVVVNESEATISFLFVDDDVEGTISDFDFTGSINLDDLENAEFSGSVVMETLDTDNWFRDRHLRSRKFFNNKQYPKLYFKSTSITPSGDTFKVDGNLKIKGISRKVSFSFEKLTNKFQGTATINTLNYNINIHDEHERNEVEITITLPYSTN